ncbi:MAG: hypothetical protein COB05_18230, partial [Marinobacter sp.]
NEGTVIDVCRPQYEKGGASTPYQRVTSDLDVYEEGQQHIEYLRFDGIDDCMTQTFPDGFEGDLIVCGTKGSWIDEGVSIPAGGELTIGLTGLPNTPNILPALGDIIGWVPVSRTTTEEERQRIIGYYKGRGAKGRLVLGPELVTNPVDLNSSDWNLGDGWLVENGQLVRDVEPGVTGTAASQVNALSEIDTTGKTFVFDIDVAERSGAFVLAISGPGADTVTLPPGTGLMRVYLYVGSNRGKISISASGDSTIKINSFSVRELIPEEDLV